MDQINEREVQRAHFMNELYKLTDGGVEEPVDTYKVAERMGLDFKGNEEHYRQIRNVVYYLDQKGLVERIADTAVGVMLTSRGIDEVERARTNPNQPTSYLPPFYVLNYISAGRDIVQSPMQVGSPGATQSVTVISEDNQQQLEVLLQDIRNSLSQLGVSSEDEAELVAELDTIDTQAASPKPKREIIKPLLQSVIVILSRATEQAAASELSLAIQQFINSM